MGIERINEYQDECFSKQSKRKKRKSAGWMINYF